MPREKVKRKMRLALAAWEIGWKKQGLGSKIGGLGAVLEELPAELVQAAALQGIELEVEVLSPCFAHYRRGKSLKPAKQRLPATLDGNTFEFEVYQARSPDRQSRLIYFWDDGQLHWTNAKAIYPEDPRMALRLYAAVSQAMAAYISQGDFDTIHLHDYHVSLIPFYLTPEILDRLPVHFTVHNATYQGNCWVGNQGYEVLESISLSGELFHRYFDYFDNLNLMKAALIKVHQLGGRITTVSGDLEGSWGYARELRSSYREVMEKAQAQKWGRPASSVFHPNGGLDVFERIPVAGITNGLAEKNRPEKLLELSGASLRARQKKRREGPFFRHPEVQSEMLRKDHRFSTEQPEMKTVLKRLLHLEAFGGEPAWDPILFTAVGRLVEQKNFGLIASVAERVFAHDAGAKFAVIGSPGDASGEAAAAAFESLAVRYPDRFFFSPQFNEPLSRLILAGGDFCLIPSRFEPCGLVDYEASLLGNVVIARRTGGLPKVSQCAYLYDWLDIGDHWGEVDALFAKIREAIYNYRENPSHHLYLRDQAMRVDASWAPGAARYVQLYRYGLQMKRWFQERRKLVRKYGRSLKKDREWFEAFLAPGSAPFADPMNLELKRALNSELALHTKSST